MSVTAGGAALGNVALSRGMRVEGSPVAAGFFDEAIGMGSGTAAARPAECSFGLYSCPPHFSCSHGGEGVTHTVEFGCGGNVSH